MLAVVRLLLVFGFLVAACTPEAAVAPSSTSAEVPGRSTTMAETASTSTTATTRPESDLELWPSLLRADCDIVETNCAGPWEAAWEADRLVVVDRIVSGGYGVGEDGILRGPGGLAVDLSVCPASWETEGVEADLIRLGFVAPNTGGNLIGPNPTYGASAYLEAVNQAGGVDGRAIDLSVEHDYSVAVEVADIDEALSDNTWFAVTTWGDVAIAEIAELLGSRCVPHALVMARTASSVASKHPFTIPYELSYEAEAELWVEYVASTWADPTPPRIAALVIDHPYGHGYLDAVTAAIEDRLPGAELTAVFHDPAAPSIRSEVAELSGTSPDVWISMTAGNACLLTIREVDTADPLPPIRLTPIGCQDPAAYLEPAGDAADGWLTLSYRSTNLADWDRRVGTLRNHIDHQILTAGFDPSVDLAVMSWAWAWHYVELLRIASALPGGLTRPNLLLAAWTADLRPPTNHPMVRFTLSGPTDLQPIETAHVNAWNSRHWRWDHIDTVTIER